MDKLQKIAMTYQNILQIQYYFEIAKKQVDHQFIISFEKGDFFHLAGLHKLKDVTVLQVKKNKESIFNSIVNGEISFSQIENSFFYNDIENRLSYLGKLQSLLDNNQIVFQYLESKNKASCIKAEYLMEEGYEKDILFMFLSQRNNYMSQGIPIMCCRSFFPMDQLDYSKNQPAYTLLKKIKIDNITGEKTVQYDRSRIMEQAKAARTEPERKSIMMQLNEKKAQLAIKDALAEKKHIQKGKQNHERF
ncbi:MAG: hypothetical protein K2J99_14280 [Lachnospiraceae bacterium]|nr:hypothetical protein [Lachnospiraceae bacterium]